MTLDKETSDYPQDYITINSIVTTELQLKIAYTVGLNHHICNITIASIYEVNQEFIKTPVCISISRSLLSLSRLALSIYMLKVKNDHVFIPCYYTINKTLS